MHHPCHSNLYFVLRLAPCIVLWLWLLLGCCQQCSHTSNDEVGGTLLPDGMCEAQCFAPQKGQVQSNMPWPVDVHTPSPHDSSSSCFLLTWQPGCPMTLRYIPVVDREADGEVEEGISHVIMMAGILGWFFVMTCYLLEFSWAWSLKCQVHPSPT